MVKRHRDRDRSRGRDRRHRVNEPSMAWTGQWQPSPMPSMPPNWQQPGPSNWQHSMPGTYPPLAVQYPPMPPMHGTAPSHSASAIGQSDRSQDDDSDGCSASGSASCSDKSRKSSRSRGRGKQKRSSEGTSKHSSKKSTKDNSKDEDNEYAAFPGTTYRFLGGKDLPTSTPERNKQAYPKCWKASILMRLRPDKMSHSRHGMLHLLQCMYTLYAAIYCEPTHMHPCMHTCIHTYIHACIPTCIHASIHSYIHHAFIH